jgi:hypothetical protein
MIASAASSPAFRRFPCRARPFLSLVGPGRTRTLARRWADCEDASAQQPIDNGRAGFSGRRAAESGGTGGGGRRGLNRLDSRAAHRGEGGAAGSGGGARACRPGSATAGLGRTTPVAGPVNGLPAEANCTACGRGGGGACLLGHQGDGRQRSAAPAFSACSDLGAAAPSPAASVPVGGPGGPARASLSTRVPDVRDARTDCTRPAPLARLPGLPADPGLTHGRGGSAPQSGGGGGALCFPDLQGLLHWRCAQGCLIVR